MGNTQTYFYKVGNCHLKYTCGSCKKQAEKFNMMHYALKLGSYIFEYSKEGVSITSDYTDRFNWDEVNISGETYTSPKDLEFEIERFGNWKGKDYDFSSHNCQDFVNFCLERLNST